MPSASSSKGGFTLFELLLVIVLIAVLYGVFISKLSSKPKAGEAVAVTIGTVGAYLQLFEEQAEGDVELVCQNACLDCDVYTGGKKVEESTVHLFESAPAVYRRDGLGQFQPVTFLPVKDSDGVLQDVCFRYTLFENGSGSSYIVGYGDDFYLFDAYLLPVTKYRALEEAETAYNKTALIPDDERQYTF